MNQQDIIRYCNDLLEINSFSDYCPNGLQVEGDGRKVGRITAGVSISIELIDKAIAMGADLILTHHGMIWNKEERIIRGPLRRKLNLLLQNGIAAAAYHLPLAFHPELGNNVQLARQLGLGQLKPFAQTPKYAQGILGTTELNDIKAFSKAVGDILERKPTVLPYGPKKIRTVAVITGGAQGYFLEAIDAGADCFITGEVSEQNYTMSREYGVHFISAGHYSTEKFGIQALGDHLATRFGLEVTFVDIPNPI